MAQGSIRFLPIQYGGDPATVDGLPQGPLVRISKPALLSDSYSDPHSSRESFNKGPSARWLEAAHDLALVIVGPNFALLHTSLKSELQRAPQ